MGFSLWNLFKVSSYGRTIPHFALILDRNLKFALFLLHSGGAFVYKRFNDFEQTALSCEIWI